MQKNIAFSQLESFNFAIGPGLRYAVNNISPVESTASNNLVISIEDAVVMCTSIPERKRRIPHFPIYPSECRLSGYNYSGDLKVKLAFKSKSSKIVLYSERIFQIPIMVKSDACIIQKCCFDKREELEDPGGYFIINGKERIFRTYLMKHRNYPFAIIRSSWKKSAEDGASYTEFGVQIRCVSSDETNSTVTLRYLSDCSVDLCFVFDGYHYFMPLMLIIKALGDKYTDFYIYNKICDASINSFSKSCIKNMLRKLQDRNVYNERQAKDTLGSKFIKYIKLPQPAVADYIIRNCILIHLDNYDDKFNLLCFMLKKLLSLVQKKCHPEKPSSFVYQELLLSGQLYLMLLKLELRDYLKSVGRILQKKQEMKSFLLNQEAADYCTRRAVYIGAQIIHALSTGNLPSGKLGLIQSSGCSVLCDRTNIIRFRSHFTRVEKVIVDPYNTEYLRPLQPESWGYLCPIHTPDGKEIGIQNYLSQTCQVTSFCDGAQTNVEETILSLTKLLAVDPDQFKDGYPVILDGKVVSVVHHVDVVWFLATLKAYRRDGKIHEQTEIVFLPHQEQSASGLIFYGALFIFTNPGRMIRPVQNYSTKEEEYICVFEQAFLNIDLYLQKVKQKKFFSHKELSFENLYSDVASLIPFFENNPSPRNILSCQMAKQALGIPSHASFWRSDSKLYHFIYPQVPLVSTLHAEENGYEEYPTGTNAVVAVMSYSGFDMEDAIILNKSSVERGLADVDVISTVVIDLQQKAKELHFEHAYALKFACGKNSKYLFKNLDEDGLPYVGQKLNYGDIFCSYVETSTDEVHLEQYMLHEPGYVHDVKLLGNYTSPLYLTKVMIKFRIKRSVDVGDKFASRHAQKGVVGKLWPSEDMPFTSSGIVPDIVINPHSFPSRMTVGMFIESMAGTVASTEACKTVVSQFQFAHRKRNAATYFGEKLKEAGFNLYGTETMCSGVSGRELKAEIFTGVVYYQRLRHMVADKYQMRSVGGKSFDARQPVKRSPKDGAIRFGEMERDAVIAHGASFLLHDRLATCSDLAVVYLCLSCYTILGPFVQELSPQNSRAAPHCPPRECQVCTGHQITQMQLPFIYLTFAAELAALNIRIILRTT